jgi:hypothetical protein
MTWKETNPDKDEHTAEPDDNQTFGVEFIFGKWKAWHTGKHPIGFAALGMFGSLEEAKGVCEIVYKSQ